MSFSTGIKLELINRIFKKNIYIILLLLYYYYYYYYYYM